MLRPTALLTKISLKPAVESLLKLGDKGKETLAGIFNSDNYQNAPNNLKAAIEIIVAQGAKDQKLLDAIVSLAGEPGHGRQL